ncbi:MAG: hypothetical protein ACOX45_09275 [Acutalibacteraceae bacterium]
MKKELTKMKRSLFLCTVVVFAGLFSLTAISAPVPITGTSQSVSLSDLVGTRTMLTVVLKDGDAKDSNLKLAEVRDDRLVFLSTTGEIVPYLLDSIASIEVQDGVVQQRRAPDLESQVLACRTSAHRGSCLVTDKRYFSTERR